MHEREFECEEQIFSANGLLILPSTISDTKDL